ncbi:MAG: hypothetical protein JRH20_02440 [Deltaproteobacteria bacterium]|nr:hypothetical protein [Deltaproteobacteria bacterium]
MEQTRCHSRVFRLPGEDGLRYLFLEDVKADTAVEARREFRGQVERLLVRGATEMVYDGRQYIPHPRPQRRQGEQVRFDIKRFVAEVERAITAVRQDPLFASMVLGPLEACFAKELLCDGYLTFLQRQPTHAKAGAPYASHASLYCALLAAQRTLGGHQRGIHRHRGTLKIGPEDALFHHGDLLISGDVQLEGALAVTGNVQVEGGMLARGLRAKVLTLGHLSAERMVSSGAVVVGGNLLLGSLLYAFGKQLPFRVRQRIQAPLLLEDRCDLLALRGLRGQRINVASRQGRGELEAWGVAKESWVGEELAEKLYTTRV